MTFHLPKAQPSSISKLLHTDFTKASRHSGSNRFLSPKSLPATQANIEPAIRTIEQMGGSGSTELIPALKRA